MLGLFLLAALQQPVLEIQSAVARGIRAGAYPGAVVVIGSADSIYLAQGYGHLTWSAGSGAPDPDSTVYDLASLTKVVATTPAIMLLVDRGLLSLDDKVGKYFPEYASGEKATVTVRQLLSHQSGLRSFLPLNERTKTAAEAKQMVLDEPLRWPPGSRVEYSDLNAMIAGWIVERVAGVSLGQFVRAEIFQPLGLRVTGFNPPRGIRKRMAPVGLWRGHVIRGKVHDQNAARLGGVSGHAGLYSTGRELARYAQLWLREGELEDGRQLLSRELVSLFTREVARHRALGWEVNDTSESNNTGTRLSPRAFGHGGYTGTSIWIDPELDLFVIILTNRVYSPRTRRSISTLKQVRARVADAATLWVER